MKLLVFSPYYPPHIGGLESYADELNKYLSQKSIGITVFTPKLPQDAPEFETKYNNVRIVRFPAFEIIANYPLPKFWLPTFWKLFSGLSDNDYTAVLSHTRFFSTSLLALVFSKKHKTKWIHIEHGSNFVQSGNFFIRLIAKCYDKTLGAMVLKKADKLVAVSASVKKFILKLCPETDPEIIYRGFDLEKIDRIEPDVKLKEASKNTAVIVYIGRLISGKGVSDLIQALNQIKNADYHCLIVGDGPEKNNLHKLADNLQLNGKIDFLGHKNFEQCMAILKIADIFVNPSYTEGLPTTVAEAALCRKAIIATNAGGTSEIITDRISGYIVEPKNISMLAQRIEALIKDKDERERFGKNASVCAREKFNWERSLGQFLKIMN